MACIFITADADEGWPAVSFWMANPACGPMRIASHPEDTSECTAFLFGTVLLHPDMLGIHSNDTYHLSAVVSRAR